MKKRGLNRERQGNLKMNVERYRGNPIITPQMVKPFHPGFEVIGAFNAGVATYKGEVLLVLRVAERPIREDPSILRAPVYNEENGELRLYDVPLDDERYDFSDPRVIRDRKTGQLVYLTSLSYLRLARSKDGFHFSIDEKPFIYPSNSLERFGIEDPRVTQIGETYYIYYSAVSPKGIGEVLVSTKDFSRVTPHGMIFAPENKDVVLFPERIGGRYYALHRPVPKGVGNPEIWIAESPDLLHWGNHRFLAGLREGRWDSHRIGSGAVPIRTEHGWLEFYHGADGEDRYSMGALLLDLEDPSRVIARSEVPVLEPMAPYEVEGFFGNVVFSCGALVEGRRLLLYYGVSDESMAVASFSLNEILDSLSAGVSIDGK